MKICVGARNSPLSREQVKEVFFELTSFYEDIEFELLLVKTHGDLRQDLSLRTLDKTDVFTKEIDELLEEGKCRIAIHSAKDLPSPLKEGITCIALTKGKTAQDSLVLRPKETLTSLPFGATIGSSSFRRDEVVQTLRPDFRCIEVRGTIEKRLEFLFTNEVDGLIVAEAALERLELTHLNRVPLPGKTAPLQGKLAILARNGDEEIAKLFAPLDTREKERRNIWYTGLDLPKDSSSHSFFHCPLIAIKPYPVNSSEIFSSFSDFSSYTHLIFTSKNGASLFADYFKGFGYSLADLEGKEVIAIGPATAAVLKERGIVPTQTSPVSTQEGIIHLLRPMELDEAYFFLPQSERSRSALARFFQVRGIRHQVCKLYNAVPKRPKELPPWEQIDEIAFTSPSTVEAFITLFGPLPKKKMTAIGPVTKEYLDLQRTLHIHK